MTVRIEIRNLKVTSLDVDFHDVSWDLGPTNQDVLDYTFTVLRSEGPEGPYDEISPAMEDKYLFVDTHLVIGNNYRQYYYKVRITEKATGETLDFGPVSHEAEADLIATELRRHVGLLMREFAARRCWVLPRRSFGQRCGCYDQDLQKKVRSGCMTCWDTSFVRGYMHPIEAWIQIDPTPQSEQKTQFGTIQQENTTARLPYFPPLKPQDVIVEAENIRWRVTKITGTEQTRARIHQEIQMHRIPSTDIEYRIPLQLDVALKDLYISPSRNKTNNQNIEAYLDEEFPNILGMYGNFLGSR